MKTMVFFLEEPSAQKMLAELLPKILPPGIIPRYLVFQGKQDLEKNLVRKLKGWRQPESTFVVMRDQDSGDCVAIKKKLIELCRQAGKDGALIRIACHELESFYLGDLEAIEKGLGIKGIASQRERSKYRNPDELSNPSEEMMKLTKGAYQKVSGSRSIGPHLDLRNNRSHSFNVLLKGLRNLMEV